MNPDQTPETPVSTPPTPAPDPTPTTPEVSTPPPAVASPAASTTVDPGHTLGIASLVLAFLVAPVGLILGVVALQKSKKAGNKNGLALAGIIIGALGTIGGIFWVITILTALASGTLTTY